MIARIAEGNSKEIARAATSLGIKNMAHKVHPKIFRIRDLSDWDSRWFERKSLPRYLEEDFKIREFLKEKLGKTGIERIEIERSGGKTNIIISSARPGLIIGRGGEGVEILKKELNKMLLKGKPVLAKEKTAKRDIRIEIREVKNPWMSSALAGQWIAQQIEKRVPCRKVLKQVIEKIAAQKGVAGCKVSVSGRLNGVEIARSEWLKRGKLPRQTLRADIDFAQEQAHCTYGVIGIKVWIYKGERFAR